MKWDMSLVDGEVSTSMGGTGQSCRWTGAWYVVVGGAMSGGCQ